MNTGNAHRSTGVVARLLAAGFAVLLLAVALFSFSAGSSHASVLRHKPPPTPTPSPTHTPSPTVTPSPSPPPGPWKLTGSMHSIRAGHTATLLQSGQVLVAGGYTDFYASVALASAELYTLATGTWTTTGSMNVARIDATATLLNNGQVLVAGGYNQTTFVDNPVPMTSAELYNPATGTWTTTGSMNVARVYHTATLLQSGQVLVAAGWGPDALASAELYNPATGTWTTTGSMSIARHFQTATLLQSGQVLVAGGAGSPVTPGATSSPLASAELFNPATGTWTTTGSMTTPRLNQTATLLQSGQMLVAGGIDTGDIPIASAELFTP